MFISFILQGSIKLYLRFYLCLHIISLVIIFILPKFIRGESRSSNTRISAGNVVRAGELQNEQKEAIANQTQTADNSDDLNVEDVEGKTEQLVEDSELAKRNDTMPQQHQQQSQNKQQQSQSPHNIILQPRPQPSNQQQQVPASPKQTCARDAVSVPHDQCEMDQLSSKLKEKIEAETKNIEEFIDKTVTETVSGIVEFKNDLMRDIEFPKLKLAAGTVTSGAANLVDAAAAGLRKRNISSAHDSHSSNNNTSNNTTLGNGVSGEHEQEHQQQQQQSGAFLKKEMEVINAVVQQANVLPAVLSNGHAK